MTDATDAALLRLDDYVRGRDADADDAYEAALFERALAGNAPELTIRDGLERRFREMKARGTIDPWLTRSQVEELATRGLKVAHQVFHAGNPQPFDIPDDADLVVTRIPVDLTGVTRLEVEISTLDGRVLKRMPDVPFDREEGALFACCEAELARTAISVTRISRFWSVGEGERRLIVETPSV